MTQGNDNPFLAPQSDAVAEEPIAFPELVACGQNLRAVYRLMLVETAVVALLAVSLAIMRNPSRGVFLAMATVFTLTTTGCLVGACGFLWKAADIPPEVSTGRLPRLAASCAALLIPVAALIFWLDGTVFFVVGGILCGLTGVCVSLFGRQLANAMQADALRRSARNMVIAFVLPAAFPLLRMTIGDPIPAFIGLIYLLMLFTSFGNLIQGIQRTIFSGPQ